MEIKMHNCLFFLNFRIRYDLGSSSDFFCDREPWVQHHAPRFPVCVFLQSRRRCDQRSKFQHQQRLLQDWSLALFYCCPAVILMWPFAPLLITIYWTVVLQDYWLCKMYGVWFNHSFQMEYCVNEPPCCITALQTVSRAKPHHGFHLESFTSSGSPNPAQFTYSLMLLAAITLSSC